MCFSNLPIEFDENGDPYLAEEAEDVERPDCGCSAELESSDVEERPREAFDAIVADVPEAVRAHLEDAAGSRSRRDDSTGSGGRRDDSSDPGRTEVESD